MPSRAISEEDSELPVQSGPQRSPRTPDIKDRGAWLATELEATLVPADIQEEGKKAKKSSYAYEAQREVPPGLGKKTFAHENCDPVLQAFGGVLPDPKAADTSSLSARYFQEELSP